MTAGNSRWRHTIGCLKRLKIVSKIVCVKFCWFAVAESGAHWCAACYFCIVLAMFDLYKLVGWLVGRVSQLFRSFVSRAVSHGTQVYKNSLKT